MLRSSNPTSRSCIAILAVLAALAAIPGPEWRVDLWSTAALGYPRLFGIWSTGALVLAWFIVLPAAALVVGARLTRSRRVVAFGFLAWWIFVTLCIVAADLWFTLQPHRIAEPALRYMPYQARHLFPDGNPSLVDDPLLLQSHRPNLVRTTHIDFGLSGNLTSLGIVKASTKSIPGLVFEATRRFGPDGFPAEFGRVAGSKPTPFVFLGDSFTVGYNLPARATWPAVALATSDDDMQSGAVYACAGMTPAIALEGLLRDAPDAHPTAVVAMYYEGNDLGDSGRVGYGIAHLPPPTEPYRRALRERRVGWLARRPLHAMLAHSIAPTDCRTPSEMRASPWRIFAEDRAAEAAWRNDPAMGSVPPKVRQEALAAAPPTPPLRVTIDGTELPLGIPDWELTQAVAMGENWPLDTLEWEYMRAGLKRLGDFRRHTGCRLVVAWAPTKLRAYLPLLTAEELARPDLDDWVRGTPERQRLGERRAAGSWKPLIERYGSRLRAAAATAAAEEGLEFIDLTPIFQEAAAASPELLYLPYDTHWSPAGHRLAGETMRQWLATGGP